MANKKVKTIPLSKARFKEARKLRGMTLADIAAHKDIDRSEKTLLRWIDRGEMPAGLLDTIGRILDVDPEFISGTFDRNAEALESDPVLCKEIKDQLNASDHPYFLALERKRDPLRFIRDIMLNESIDPSQLDALSFKEIVRLDLELENAVRPILRKYFKPHVSSLREYSIPMPPEDEIIKG